MSEQMKIRPWQLTVLVTMITVGDSILVLPAIPAFQAKQDAWISAIVGLLAGLAIIFLFVKASKLNAGLTLVELNRHILGRWVGPVVSLLFLLYLLITISAILREFGDFSVTHMLPGTPVEAVLILFLLPVIAGAWLGLETVSRAGEIFVPFFFLFVLVLTFALLPQLNWHNILPILEGGIKPILRGSFACISFPFAELVVLMMIFPAINRPDETMRSMQRGALIGGIIIITAILFSVLVLGAESAGRDQFPSYELVKTISIGKFFERAEEVFAVLWFITGFFKVTIFFYSFNLGLSQLIKLNDRRIAMLPVGMIAIALAILIAPNITYYNYFISRYWYYMDFFFSVGVPLLLFVVYVFRRKKLIKEQRV